ncbi:mannose-1-phosphate guanylyltransferase [Brachybacterium sp. DNPG3]
MTRAPFVPVIPAGGSGTRLWPLSRRERPKFLLDLLGTGSSLLEGTVERVGPLAGALPIVVTGTAHADAVREQAGDRARVVVEPSPRNSMPAIALAAAIVESEHPDAVIGSFAADHLIADAEGFRAAVDRAREAAEQGYLVTIGVEPTHPATGFGYIERSETTAPADPADGTASDAPSDGALPGGALPVARFVEKPAREQAEEFLATGRFLWNAGMFVVRARTLLDDLAEQIPSLAAGVREIASALAADAGSGTEVLERVWPTLTAIAIDHALAEPLAARGRVAVVPASFDWDDVGDFAALARQLRSAAAGDLVGPATSAAGGASDVRVLGSAEVDAVDARATVYGSGDRRIALVGVEGISVVDTPEVLLVLADDAAQDLSSLVASLDGRGLGRLR